MTRLFIAICYHGAAMGFVASLVRYAQVAPPGTVIAFDNSGGCVGIARNNLTAKFLRSACTHLLFIDSDIVFEPEHVQRLISHELPVVGGLYPIKGQGPLDWCANGFPDREYPVLETGLQRIRYLGTGFLLIHRRVIEQQIAADRAEIEYLPEGKDDVQWDVWRMGVRKTDDPKPRRLTEDWFFCQRCLELGIPVFADTKVLLQHVGTAVWPLPHQRS